MIQLVIVTSITYKIFVHSVLRQWNFISTWYVLYWLWVKISSSLCLYFLLALFFEEKCKKWRGHWVNQIVNPVVTIEIIFVLQYCKESVLFQKETAPFHQLQECSHCQWASSFIDLLCGYQGNQKWETLIRSLSFKGYFPLHGQSGN